MDWIEEKVEDFRRWLKNLPICKALLMYQILAILAAAAAAFVTASVLADWSRVIYERCAADMPNAWHAIEGADLKRMLLFQKLAVVLPFLYLSIAVLASAVLFWHKRLKTPFLILKNSAGFIREDNLDFKTEYDSRDEMGELCRSFEEMRRELVRGKEEMWKLIEDQREINAAFAHDLRTPLTVLRGYSDFLYRYIPEGKISADKLTETLKLMSEHIRRLESYSYTMKGIRSFEELEPLKAEMEVGRLASCIGETAEALNRIGEMEISFESAGGSEESHSNTSSWRAEGKRMTQNIYVDENLILEVVENLLSNAIRYARKRVKLLLKIKESEEMLYLYVSDDGPGFTGEELQKAAQPYFRGASPGTKEERAHFGIGLHISRILCKKHGGTLSLANSIDGGALVSVSFSYRKS